MVNQSLISRPTVVPVLPITRVLSWLLCRQMVCLFPGLVTTGNKKDPEMSRGENNPIYLPQIWVGLKNGSQTFQESYSIN